MKQPWRKNGIELSQSSRVFYLVQQGARVQAQVASAGHISARKLDNLNTRHGRVVQMLRNVRLNIFQYYKFVDTASRWSCVLGFLRRSTRKRRCLAEGDFNRQPINVEEHQSLETITRVMLRYVMDTMESGRAHGNSMSGSSHLGDARERRDRP